MIYFLLGKHAEGWFEIRNWDNYFHGSWWKYLDFQFFNGVDHSKFLIKFANLGDRRDNYLENPIKGIKFRLLREKIHSCKNLIMWWALQLISVLQFCKKVLVKLLLTKRRSSPSAVSDARMIIDELLSLCFKMATPSFENFSESLRKSKVKVGWVSWNGCRMFFIFY